MELEQEEKRGESEERGREKSAEKRCPFHFNCFMRTEAKCHTGEYVVFLWWLCERRRLCPRRWSRFFVGGARAAGGFGVAGWIQSCIYWFGCPCFCLPHASCCCFFEYLEEGIEGGRRRERR